MSIEQALAENTAAIKELIATNKELLAARSETMNKIESITSASSGSKKATEKPTEKASDKPQINTSPEDRKENPYEGVKDIIAHYLAGTDREEERAARKEKVKALLNHAKIKKPDVETATAVDHIMEDAVPLFKEQMAKLEAKGDLVPVAKKDDDLEI